MARMRRRMSAREFFKDRGHDGVPAITAIVRP